MANNYLFMCIGNNDLQRIYASTDKNVRSAPNPYEPPDSENDEIVEHFHFEEKRRIDNRQDKNGEVFTKTNKICFPMYDKAMLFLAEHNVSQIECLYLICTKRDQIVDKLGEIANSPGLDAETRGYAKALKGHADRDKTSITANFLADNFQRIPSRRVNVNTVKVLELGTQGFFQPLLDANLQGPEADLFSVLRRADINILDFFDSELYECLKNDFRDINNNKLYMATYAGGMPIMQRALDNVLDNCLCYSERIRIFNSEYRWYQLESEPQQEFLAWMHAMIDNVLRLNWHIAHEYFTKIKERFPRQLGDDNRIESIKAVFDRAIEILTEAESDWLDNFTILLLRGLYDKNYNDVLIWLKCIEEAAWEQSLNNEKDKEDGLWEQVETTMLPNGRREKRVIWKDNDETKYCAAYPNVLVNHFEPHRLHEAVGNYLNLYYKPCEMKYQDEWYNLFQMRNKLVHSGENFNDDVGLILRQVKIIPEDLDAVIHAIQLKDLASIISQEKQWMGYYFFKTLRKIAGKNQQDYLPPIRSLCNEFFEALYSDTALNNLS